MPVAAPLIQPRWTRKPQPGTRIDRGDLYAGGLAHTYLANEGAGGQLLDMAGNRLLAPSGITTPWGLGYDGPAIQNNAGTGVFQETTGLTLPLNGKSLSWFCLAYQRSTGASGFGTYVYIDQSGSGASGGTYFRVLNDNAGHIVFNAQTNTFAGANQLIATPTANQWFWLGATWDGAASGVLTAYYAPVGGVWTVATGTAGTSTNTASRITLLNFPSQVSTARGFDGLIAFQYFWAGRILQLDDFKALALDPYRVFLPARRTPFIIFLGAAAGGPTTYNQTVTTSQAQVVALAKQPALIRALSQAQTLALAKTPALTRSVSQSQTATASTASTFRRTLSIAQSQAAALLQQVGLVRSTSQAQSVAASKTINLVRSVAQSQAVAVTYGFQHVLTLAVSQAQTALRGVLRVSQARAVTQTQAVAVTKQVRQMLSVTQSQSVALRKGFFRTLAVTQAQVVSLASRVIPAFVRVKSPTSVTITPVGPTSATLSDGPTSVEIL